MIAQFSIYPTDTEHFSKDVKQVAGTLSAKGLDHRVGPIGTCIEGNWDTVFAAIRQCHEEITAQHKRVVTTIIVDDHKGRDHSLDGAVKAVEIPMAPRHPSQKEALGDA